MTKQKKGILLIVLADVLFFLNKLTGDSILGFVGRMLCGDSYLKPVAGESCGSNYDMYFFLFLLVILLLGLALIVIPILKKKSAQKEIEQKKLEK